MPATTTATHNGTTITFTEDDHRYESDRGETFTSVTTLIGSYFPKFDALAESERMEAEGKGNAEELRTAWDATTAAACEYGTRCHETAESLLQGLTAPHSPISDRERKAFAQIWDYCQLMLNRVTILKCEALVFSNLWQIAGSVDLIARTETGKILILDWKTNRELTTEGFNGATALDPIAHLPDASMAKYTLQLNLYQRIIEREGYFPRGTQFDRGILYVNPDKHDRVQYIAIPDMQMTISTMIIDRLERLLLPF